MASRFCILRRKGLIFTRLYGDPWSLIIFHSPRQNKVDYASLDRMTGGETHAPG